MTQNIGFEAVLKSRYSDFQVNEIDKSGQVLELNNMDVPKMEKTSKCCPSLSQIIINFGLYLAISKEEIGLLQEELKSVVTETQWKAMKRMALAKYTRRLGFQPVVIDVENVSPDLRAKIHQAVRKIYQNKLTSCLGISEKATKNGVGSGKRVIKVTCLRQNKKVCLEWTFKKDYVHFLVYKENLDTNVVASTFADRLQ